MLRPVALAAFLLYLTPAVVAQDDAQKTPTDTATPAATPTKTKVTLLRPSGSYEDLAESSFDPTSLLLGGGAKPKSFFELRTTIEGLGKAESSTVLLDLTQPLGLNLPQVREIERAMAKVRESGKKVVCYFENATPVTLQLAALCDRVVMTKMGSVDFRSPAMNVMHYKDALALLGIEVEMTRVGEFKGAVEPYVRSTMSEPLKKHYHAMLASINEDVVRRVAAGRKLDAARVKEMQAQRLFTGAEAKAAGLVDEIVEWDGAERALETLMGSELGEFELVDAVPKKNKKNRDLLSMVSEMFKQKREDDEDDEETSIVVLHLAGGISDGSTSSPGSLVSGPSVKEIEALTKNDNVKGVVVRVNSPGGSATASEAIRRALERLADKKPVVFSMGELAASGGYWITCIGKPILAEATTITGSIGVFSMRFQTGALMRRLGVHTEIVSLDAGAEMDAADRPWTDAARGRMQSFVDGIYDQFIDIAAKSRKLPPDAVRAIAGGRVWSGAQAVEIGIVDAVGGVDDALAMVRTSAGIGDDIEVRHLPQPKDFAQSIVEQMFDASALVQAEPSALAMFAQLSRLDGLLALLRSAIQPDSATKVWALLPGDLRIR
ncbi:MAG: signal peptide peptidase SppA [Planctomycetota bacterium]